MIRGATTSDIAAIVSMIEQLRASVRSPLVVDPMATGRFVAALLSNPVAAIWVVEGDAGPTGFLAASVGTASISMAPIAVEHGWWAAQGGGLALLKAYLAWADEQGCFAVRMSTPPHNERAARILKRFGFEAAETAWVKVI